MKPLCLFVFLWASVGWTQSTTAGDAVIATFDDGGIITLGEYQALLRANPEWQGQDREKVLFKYATLRKAAAMAKAQRLDEKSPYKESLEFSRMISLADIAVREATSSFQVNAAEIEKFYDEHKEPFKLVKVSGIKIAYGPNGKPSPSGGPEKTRTWEEAKEKAEKLVAQIRAGADFVKLVQLESDDEDSRGKGGYIATWRTSENVPEDLRMAAFGLKIGDVSDPVPQPGGFYIVRADSIAYTPLAEVEDMIVSQLKKQHTQEWVRNLEQNTTVSFPAKQEPPAGSSALPGSAK